MSELENTKPIVRAGLLVIFAGIVGMVVWAYVAPLTGAVIAPGFVKIDLNRKVVQHQEGGIVSAIRVRDGDRVKAGQELIVLDDVRVDAQLDLLRTQYDTERAKAARLEAERAFAEKLVFPRDIAERQSDPRINEVVVRESGLFRARRWRRNLQPKRRRSSCRRRSSLRTSGCSRRAISRKRAS